jgi:hypothetical protein
MPSAVRLAIRHDHQGWICAPTVARSFLVAVIEDVLGNAH